MAARRASPDVRNWDRAAQVSNRAVDRGLATGIDRRPLATAHRIDEYDSGNLVAIEIRESAHDHAAEGMPDQNVRRMNARDFQHPVKLACGVRGRTFCARRAAPTKAAAIVSHRTCEAGHFILDRAPVEMSGGDSGFEDHGGVSSPFFDHEKVLPFSDFNPSAAARVAKPIASRGYELVYAAKNEERREETEQQEKCVHSDAKTSEAPPH